MQPRGIRNNNPGNIEIGAPWQGLMSHGQMTPEQRAETRFCVFEDPTWGIRAIARTLITYQDKRRARDGSAIDTVQEIVDRWAPPNENDTNSYAWAIRQALGIEPGTVVNVHEYRTMRVLVEAVIQHENGIQPYTSAQIDKGLVLAGIQPPAAPSRTIAAGKVAAGATGIGAAANVIADNADAVHGALTPMVPYLPWIGYALAAVTLIAVGRMLYARWDDKRRGVNP